MSQCEFLETCGFLKKYQKKYAKLIKNIREDYCDNLDKSENCAIKKCYLEGGEAPSSNLMPNGEMVDPFAE